jgi:pimeloyl-ACP methyl ester carboxylesterase
MVRAAPGVLLWAEMLAGQAARPFQSTEPFQSKEPLQSPLLLIADAGASGLMWPEGLVALLSEHHPVIRYDHRDTGRSSTTPDDASYGVAELADDAVAVLEAFDVERAHVLGWGAGGHIAQLLLLDHASRFASATLLATGPLPVPHGPTLPGPPTALRRLLAELDDPRDQEGELAWRLALDRLLHGDELPFDADAFRARHERAMAHAGMDDPVVAHAHLDVPARGAALCFVDVPALVIEAPADPVFPPPSAALLADMLGRARLVQVPGLGHVFGEAMAYPLVETIVEHTMSIPTSA